MTTLTERSDLEGTLTRSSVALAIGSLLVILGAAYFVWSGISTATGRIAATTSNDSSFISAAAIDLVVDAGDEAASTGLLIDASGLYPGLVVERCFAVSYLGVLDDVPVRLFGRPGGGTGLEAFIETTVETGSGADNECGDFASTSVLFDATLLDLWNRHGSFDTGIPVITAAEDGASKWLRITVEVIDDNDAQDLTTAFWLTLEARP